MTAGIVEQTREILPAAGSVEHDIGLIRQLAEADGARPRLGMPGRQKDARRDREQAVNVEALKRVGDVVGQTKIQAAGTRTARQQIHGRLFGGNPRAGIGLPVRSDQPRKVEGGDRGETSQPDFSGFLCRQCGRFTHNLLGVIE